MRFARFLPCALLPLAATAAAQPISLEGLWVAEVRNGPDVRGSLLLVPRDGGLVANIAGFAVPVKQQGKALSFELPDGKGNFRGVRNGRAIDGQWVQAITMSSGAR